MITSKISGLINIFLQTLYLKNQKYIIFNNSTFICLPNCINLLKKKNYYFIFNKSDLVVFSSFIIQFNAWLKIQTGGIIKKLVLKGLGLKAKVYSVLTSKFLELKLGFSHLINFPIPASIQVKVNKTLIFVCANNKVILGNFLSKIYCLKKPNAYKGKGIWYKNEIKVLKIIKKV